METRTDANAPLAAVRACLEALSHTVSIARRLLQAGRWVDLTGLDAEMGFVCARALDLPPDDGRTLRPELVGLTLELEALAVALAFRAPPRLD